MSSLERLPPDQRAVLALVLQRGRSYDEIANLLAIDRAAVRDRALAALDALGPSEPRVPAERRALITDYLLGQLPDRVREETRERLASSPSERAWARVLAGELAPLSSAPLPEIPSAQAAARPAPTPEPATPAPATPGPAAPGPAAPGPAAQPEPAAPPEPATPAPAPTPTATGARDGAPTPRAVPAAAAAPSPPRPAGGGLPESGPPLRSSSRRSGGALLAIAALIAVAVVIVIIATSGGSSPKKSSTRQAVTPPATTSTPTGTGTGTGTSTSPHVIAQIVLRPANRSSKAAGVAEIVTEGTVTGVIVAADHLAPNSSHNAYAVWLATPGGASHLLGYVSPGVGKKGTLKTSGPLPSNVGSYKDLLITLETTTNTKTPGPTVLQGAVALG